VICRTGFIGTCLRLGFVRNKQQNWLWIGTIWMKNAFCSCICELDWMEERVTAES
jgi:hypothetical protein